MRPEVTNSLKPRILQLIETAMRWLRLLESGKPSSQAEIACQEGFSRSRVHQILALSRLAVEIRRYIASERHAGRCITERTLRPIARISDRRRQVEQFLRLVAEMRQPTT
jgi:hypothetical protein